MTKNFHTCSDCQSHCQKIHANQQMKKQVEERDTEFCKACNEYLKIIDEYEKLKKQIDEKNNKISILYSVLEQQESEILDNQKIIKRLKLKADKYSGKKGWEFIDDLLQSILRGDKK